MFSKSLYLAFQILNELYVSMAWVNSLTWGNERVLTLGLSRLRSRMTYLSDKFYFSDGANVDVFEAQLFKDLLYLRVCYLAIVVGVVLLEDGVEVG
jgi:hypothetical protein